MNTDVEISENKNLPNFHILYFSPMIFPKHGLKVIGKNATKEINLLPNPLTLDSSKKFFLVLGILLCFLKKSIAVNYNSTAIEFLNNSTAIDFFNKSNKILKTKKKILLEFGVSGLGNRLIAISSAAYMSILLDRVLEISWEKNIGCEASYLKLFDPLPQHIKFQPFLQDYDHVKIAGGSKRKLNTCYMHLDGVEDPQHGYIRYEQFHIVNNPNLLKKLDKDCDIINIKANIYFTHLLLNNLHGIYASEIKSHFTRPFHSISNVVFKPQKLIFKKIDEIKKFIYRINKVFER
jgi:hypothetical protein